MPKYDVPKLADYSGAIQANNSMVNAFSSLGNQSQDYLKQEEQKKQNEWNRVFEENKMKLETDKYNSELQDKADKKEANATTMKTLFPEQVKEVGLQYGQMPTIENQNKMNNFLGNADIKSFYDNQKFINDNKKDERDYLYQANRDRISDGFRRDEIAISRANANKPSELDRIMSILAPSLVGGKGGDVNIPKDTMQPNSNLVPTNGSGSNSTAFVQPQSPQTNQPVVAPQGQQPLSVGSSNQPYGIADYVTRASEKELVDDKGNKYIYNPVTKRRTLTEQPKSKTLAEDETAYKSVNGSRQAIEAIDKAIANYSDSFVGPIDGNLDFDTLNSAEHDRFNEGLNALRVENTNSLKGALSDKDMALLNRLMPNVKTETDFKKQLEIVRNNLLDNHNRAVLEYGKKYTIGDDLKYKNLSQSNNLDRNTKKQSWKDYDNE